MLTSTRNAVTAALWTALWAFLGVFGAATLGWLAQVTQWASAHGRDPFPDVSVLGYAFIAAACGGLAGLVGLLVRLAQAKGVIPGQPPHYFTSTSTKLPDTPRSRLGNQTGAATLACLSVTLALLATVVLAT